MTTAEVQRFIAIETKKAELNYMNDVYSLDKALGALAVLSNLAAHIQDVDALNGIALILRELRESDARRIY